MFKGHKIFLRPVHEVSLHVPAQAIFKTCWQTFGYKHFSGRENCSQDAFCFVSLQRMIWASPASRPRTSRRHRHSQPMQWTLKPPTMLPRTCWVRVIQRRIATSDRSITITTTIIIMLDFRTPTKNTRCQRRPQLKSTQRIIRLSTVIKWSGKSTSSRDKSPWTWRKYF